MMLNVRDGKALLCVSFPSPTSSITLLALAKRFKMSFEKLVQQHPPGHGAPGQGPTIAQYRVDVGKAIAVMDEINQGGGKRAWLDEKLSNS